MALAGPGVSRPTASTAASATPAAASTVSIDAAIASSAASGPSLTRLEAIAASMETVLAAAGVADAAVLAVGLDTPGPASATGVISSKGSTNFQQPAWRGYDIRSAAESRLGLPVIYNNDGNAAALYAHEHLFRAETLHRSSVAAIVGTGLGGGVVEHGTSSAARPAWPASSGTCRSRSTACSSPISRSRTATADWAATSNRSPR